MEQEQRDPRDERETTFRAAVRQVEAQAPPEGPVPPARLPAELFERLTEGRIQGREREALRHRWVEGRTYEEARAWMDCSAATARRWTRRAVARLQASFGRETGLEWARALLEAMRGPAASAPGGESLHLRSPLVAPDDLLPRDLIPGGEPTTPYAPRSEGERLARMMEHAGGERPEPRERPAWAQPAHRQERKRGGRS